MRKDEAIERIWNRACLLDQAFDAKEGDLALIHLMKAHGVIMNGGVLHLVERSSELDIEEISAAYCYFKLQMAKDIIVEANELLKGSMISESNEEYFEEKFDSAYATIIPTDEALFNAVQKYYAHNPTKFASV